MTMQPLENVTLGAGGRRFAARRGRRRRRPRGRAGGAEGARAALRSRTPCPASCGAAPARASPTSEPDRKAAEGRGDAALDQNLAVPPAWRRCGCRRSGTGICSPRGATPRAGSSIAITRAGGLARRGEVRPDAGVQPGAPRIGRPSRTSWAGRGSASARSLCTVVRLLETTLIRVGNDEYAKAAELRPDHAARPALQGRGGEAPLRLSRQGRQAPRGDAQEPAARPSCCAGCRTSQGRSCSSTSTRRGSRSRRSADVNAFLREVAGGEFTAKDFRTWSATVLAAWALKEFEAVDSQAAAKRNITQAIERVAGGSATRRRSAGRLSRSRSWAPISRAAWSRA